MNNIVTEPAALPHVSGNEFSMRRLGMIWRLWWPSLKMPLAILAAAVLLLFPANALLMKATGTWHAMLLGFPLLVIFVCAPVMLTRRDHRVIMEQLPVTAAEKMTFLVSLFYVGVTLLMIAMGQAGVLLVRLLFGYDVNELMAAEIPAVESGSAGVTYAYGLVMMAMLLAVGLYYVVKKRTNRAAACLVSTFVAYLATMMLAGVAMFGVGFYVGYMEAVAPEAPETLTFADGLADGLAATQSGGEALVEAMQTWMMWVIGAVSLAGWAIYTGKLYGLLRRGGF